MRTGGFEEYVSDSIPLYLTEAHAKNANMVAEMKSMMNKGGADVAIHQYEAIINLKKPFDNLSDIICPSLIVCGEEDQRTSLENAESLCDKIPNASLRIVENSAHFVPIEEPVELSNTLSSWLSLLK